MEMSYKEGVYKMKKSKCLISVMLMFMLLCTSLSMNVFAATVDNFIPEVEATKGQMEGASIASLT